MGYFELPEGNTIMEVRAVGLSIFVSTYAGDLFIYEGNELTKSKKYKGEWVRFRYDCIDGKSSRKVFVPLYCDRDNKLFLGNNLITTS